MKNNFLQGTLILTVAGFVVKAIGSINWIILSRILGGEGIGIYQMAFPIYLLALNISSAGIPIAISIITAAKIGKKDYFGAKKAFKVSLTLLSTTGILLSLLVFFGADWLIEEHIIRESRAYYSLIALAPAVFFATIISCFRGYLQGWQMMTPTAISQIVEQLFRVFIMLIFAYWLLPYGYEYAAGGASLGAGFGALAALFVLIYYYYKLQKTFPKINEDTNNKDDSTKEILKKIIKLSIPISMTSILLPLIANLDLIIVPRQLEVAGFTTARATEAFGYLTGMSIPLINLATILTAALATSIIPAISNFNSIGDSKSIFYRVASSIRICLIATIPFSVMLFILAEPIVTFIYNAPGAAYPTKILAITIFLLGLHQVTTGILQGLGKIKIPVINMGIAAIVKVTLNWYLVAIPSLNIGGAAYASIADIGIAAILNLYFVYKYTNYLISIKSIIQNVFSALIMGIVMYYLYIQINSYTNLFISLTLTLIIGSFTYLAIMTLVGGLSKKDWQKIPLLK